MTATFRLIKAEFMKAVRLKLPWMGLFFSALMAFAAKHAMERMGAPGESSMRTYLTTNLNLLSTTIIPIFSTVFAATLVASETSAGTLRMLLPRPIRRSSFLHAKIITAISYLVLLFLSNMIVALPIAATYPLKTSFDNFQEFPSLAAQIQILATTLLLTFIPHAATVCLALFISTISRSVATAIGVAVGLVLCHVPIQLINIGSIRVGDYMFSSYYDDAIGIGDSLASGIYASWNQENMHMLLITSILSSLLFLAIAYRTFTHRDMNG